MPGQKVPRVRLYIRITLPDGSRPFLDPVCSENHKLKEGWAVHKGQPKRFDEAVYHLRYLKNGKRCWERLGTDAQQAVLAKKQLEVYFEGVAMGVIKPEAPAPGSTATPVTSGRSLLECMASYVAETKEHKAKKTFAAYSETLLAFLESLDSRHRKQPALIIDPDTKVERRPTLAEYTEDPKLLAAAVRQKTIESITREEMLAFKTFLAGRGNEPRTVYNRVEFFQIFLHHFGLPSILKGKDKPSFTEKKVRAYNSVEIDRMFQAATLDESDLLQFLLSTGTREQEVQFACWSDVDLIAKTHTVTEHRDLGFTPKDGEEGNFVIPDVLVDALSARRKRHPGTRLIFPTRQNKPNGHLLRIVKRLALHAGVNCGHCVNKRGKSCATHPVCRHVILHKMRKTYATTLHRNGIPARTIMGYLRHSDLETTLRYLADGDDEQTREKINAAFGSYGQTGVAA